MIVPATRRYLTDLKQLVAGHHYSTDSNLGGSYTVKFEGIFNKRYSFSRVSGDGKQMFRFPPEEVLKNVFVCVPQELYEKKQQDEYKYNRYVDLYHENECPACLANRPRPLLAILHYYLIVDKDHRSAFYTLAGSLKKSFLGTAQVIHLDIDVSNPTEENGKIASQENDMLVVHDGDTKSLIGEYEIGTDAVQGTLVVFAVDEINPFRGERTYLKPKK